MGISFEKERFWSFGNRNRRSHISVILVLLKVKVILVLRLDASLQRGCPSKVFAVPAGPFAGEQILDGRSSPWNTLALWSVRKLVAWAEI